MPTGNGSSLAKIEANRRNAQKSTGPKTQAGKDKSKLNAIKHGLVAQATVIPVGEAKESDDEFTQLLDRVMTEFEPQGFIEEMLTERIAICYWRLRRAAYAEVGEIRQTLETSEGQAYEDDLSRFYCARAKCEQFDSRIENVEELLSTVVGIEFVIDHVEAAQKKFDKKGLLDDETLEKLSKYLGFNCDEDMYDLSPDQIKIIARKLDEEKERLLAKKARLEENRQLRHEINPIRSAIPLDVSRIIRYETTIERAFYKALNKLEELQQRRKAELHD